MKTLLAAQLLIGTMLFTLTPATAPADTGGNLRRLTEPPPMPQEQRAKVADWKATLAAAVTPAVERAIQNPHPANQSEAVSHYFREFGGKFNVLLTNANFTPEYFKELTSLTAIPTPLVLDGNLFAAREIINGLYTQAYNERGRAEVEPAAWMIAIAKEFREAISRGISKTGREPIAH